MPRPLLPPKGVFIATPLMFDLTIPPPVRLTAIQLRALAWGTTVTPPLRIQEITALTGKSQASIYEHMSFLRDIGVLSWRTTELGTIMVSFSPEYSGAGVPAKSPPSPTPQSPVSCPAVDSRNLEIPPNADSENLESLSRVDSKILETSPHPHSENLESPVNLFNPLNPQIQESDPLSLNPLSSSHHDSSLDHPDHEHLISSPSNKINPSDINGVNEMNVKEINIVESISNPESLGGERESEGERGSSTFNVSTLNVQRFVVDTPQSIYTTLTGVIPTPEQVIRMELRVKDLDIWKDSIQHWLSHRWNPKNVAFLLELYVRGGAKGCFFCAHGNHPRRTHFPSGEKP